VKPENLHFTLKFLGYQSEEQLSRVMDGLVEATTGITSFELSLVGLGGFPDLRRPRVLWVGASDGADASIALAQEVDESLHRQGVPREERSFSPHLTIGRLKDPRGFEPLRPAFTEAQSRALGRLAVSAIHLMRSDLSPEGAHYTILHTCPLSR
jgi:2'-5' RNA ligase